MLIDRSVLESLNLDEHVKHPRGFRVDHGVQGLHSSRGIPLQVPAALSVGSVLSGYEFVPIKLLMVVGYARHEANDGFHNLSNFPRMRKTSESAIIANHVDAE
jgi:hypothetical protein